MKHYRESYSNFDEESEPLPHLFEGWAGDRHRTEPSEDGWEILYEQWLATNGKSPKVSRARRRANRWKEKN